jgi:tripartite-type tricarboxylate transporter receptor subunit TctC
MKVSRRRCLHLAVGAPALMVLQRRVLALDYPTRPVRLIVGFPAGSSSDLTARLIAEWLSERLGQQFAVENRTGAGTSLPRGGRQRANQRRGLIVRVTSASDRCVRQKIAGSVPCSRRVL